MTFYLLQEDGSKILLEDGTGAILLEQVSGPTIIFTAGGAGHPGKHRKRTHELFDAMEATLRHLLGLDEDVPDALPASAGTESQAILPWSDQEIQATLGRLRSQAEGSRLFSARLAHLEILLAQFAQRQAFLQDEEDTWILMD